MGFGRRPGYTRCKVNFVGSLFNDHPEPGVWTKPSTTNKGLEEWEIESKKTSQTLYYLSSYLYSRR